MRRPLEHVGSAAPLDRMPCIHDVDALACGGDDAQVMADQQQRHAQAFPQLANEREDLGLSRDIQRRGWLIGDKEPGPARERHGEQRPLAHAARELVRKGVYCGRRQLHERQQFGYPCLQRQRRRVPAHALADLLAHPHDRVQVGQRILEHHRHRVPAHGLPLVLAELRDILPADRDASGFDPGDAARNEAQRCPRKGRLSRARFADQPNGLALGHRQRNIVHGKCHSAARAVSEAERVDFEDVRHA